jgi:hypothetical protein
MIDSSTLPDTTDEDRENESSGDEGRHPTPIDIGFFDAAYFPAD